MLFSLDHAAWVGHFNMPCLSFWSASNGARRHLLKWHVELKIRMWNLRNNIPWCNGQFEMISNTCDAVTWYYIHTILWGPGLPSKHKVENTNMKIPQCSPSWPLPAGPSPPNLTANLAKPKPGQGSYCEACHQEMWLWKSAHWSCWAPEGVMRREVGSRAKDQ